MMVFPAGRVVAIPCFVKLQPTPNTTSACGRKWWAGPDITPPPPVPSANAWSSGNAPLPSRVVMTGAGGGSEAGPPRLHQHARRVGDVPRIARRARRLDRPVRVRQLVGDLGDRHVGG